MNIKSLLLGSAAAFVAVSGARAADAVVIAEPEPMEYVRICDTYGVGFYYIPGTETCLKVSGYIRYDVNVGYKGIKTLDKSDAYDDGDYDVNDTYDKQARFGMRFDARSETEMGTLRAYAAINFNYDTGVTAGVSSGTYNSASPFGPYPFSTSDGSSVSVEHAYIELGGFRVGKTDSLFTTFTGYSSGVTNDGLVPYGPFDVHQMAYTWNGGNGFTAAVALELGSGSDIAPFHGDLSPSVGDFYSSDSYVPNVVGGIGYTAGWGGITVVAGYDSVWEEYAVKGRVDFNVNDAISLFVMAAYASVDDDRDVITGDSPNFYAPWGGDYGIWAGGAWQFNEKTTFNFEVGYDDLEDFSIAANIDYELVHNFHVIPEIFYVDNFNDDEDNVFNYNAVDDDLQKDNWGARLRLQANFGG